MKQQYNFRKQLEQLAEQDTSGRRFQILKDSEGVDYDVMNYCPGEKEHITLKIGRKKYTASYRAVNLNGVGVWEFLGAKKL